MKVHGTEDSMSLRLEDSVTKHVSSWRAVGAGMMSGGISAVIFQPFEVVKTRMQKARAAGEGDVSMTRVAVQIVRKDGVTGMWYGVKPALLRAIPGIGLYFGFMDVMKSFLTKDARAMTTAEAGAVGATARFLAGTILMPVTVLKTRYESGLFGYSGMRDAFVTIAGKEGPSRLFAGLVPTMILRDIPFAALYLIFYTDAQRYWPLDAQDGDRFALTVLHASFAGVMANVLTHPPDVVRTRMQLSREHMPISSALTSIYADFGLVGFFRGLLPRLIRRTLMSCLSWVIYEHAKRH